MANDATEMVLVGPEPELTGFERLVIAFRSNDDLYIPLDVERPANEALLNHERLYVWRSNETDSYSAFDVVERRHLNVDDQDQLKAVATHPVSVTTEVLHLRGAHHSESAQLAQAQGFVAVIDGSERAMYVLGPAAELATWYKKSLRVIAVRRNNTDTDTVTAAQFQLDDMGLPHSELSSVDMVDLEVCLFEQMRQGQIVVAAAFGVWEADGRLHSILNRLVAHNSPAVIGIGPHLASEWKPATENPIVICVDSSAPTSDFVNRLEPFISPLKNPLLVIHISTDTEPGNSAALQVASQLKRRYGVSVEAKHIHGTDVARSISTVAATVNAQLVLVDSWHRPTTENPNLLSTSLSSVVHAPCPVAILTAP